MPHCRVLLVLPLLVMLALSGCIQLYRMDIQQGNVVTQEMIDKLKPGMTRSQVRFVLGTPLISDAFHPNRWDYFFSYRAGVRTGVEQRRLTVLFDGERLVRLEGDVISPEMKRFNAEATQTVPPALLGPPEVNGNAPPLMPSNGAMPPSPTETTRNTAAPVLRPI